MRGRDEEARHSPPLPPAHLERNPGHEPARKDEVKEMDKKSRIRIVSCRHRLCDPGGISEKAAIDGLVDGGVLRDDSTKEIQEPIHHVQEKVSRGAPEVTIITVEEVE